MASSSSLCRWTCLRMASSCVRSLRGYRLIPTSCHALRYQQLSPAIPVPEHTLVTSAVPQFIQLLYCRRVWGKVSNKAAVDFNVGVVLKDGPSSLSLSEMLLQCTTVVQAAPVSKCLLRLSNGGGIINKYLKSWLQ